MNYIDYIIIAIILIGFILGFKDGLVRKIIGILGIILGIIFAIQFSKSVGVVIAPILNDELYLAEIVAGFLIFVGTIFTFALIKRVIHPFDKVNQFVNQILGGIAGAIQIIFFTSAFLLFLNIFDIPSRETRNNSFLYSKVYNVIPYSIELILGGESNPDYFIKDMIED